jgi:hypothetical protein
MQPVIDAYDSNSGDTNAQIEQVAQSISTILATFLQVTIPCYSNGDYN